MDVIKENAKALVALLSVLVLSYLTPEAINAMGLQVAEIVKVLIISGLTATVVWLTRNKPT
jgi:Na+-translocating ferredoxin:NAD+ oxidoreductase RnfE subunit